MQDIIIIAVVALIVGLACGYIYKEKKKGTKCIGCPVEGCCARKGQKSCGSDADKK